MNNKVYVMILIMYLIETNLIFFLSGLALEQSFRHLPEHCKENEFSQKLAIRVFIKKPILWYCCFRVIFWTHTSSANGRNYIFCIKFDAAKYFQLEALFRNQNTQNMVSLKSL